MAIRASADILDEVWFGEGSTFGALQPAEFQRNGNGEVTITPKMANARRRYLAVNPSVTTAELRALMVFMASRQGGIESFKFIDKMDFSTDDTDVGTAGYEDSVLGIGDGVTTQWQLRKYYGKQTPYEVVRNLTDTDDTTIKVGVNGVLQTLGIGYTIPTVGNGVIQISPALAKGSMVTGGCQFYTRGIFDFNVQDWLEAAIHNPNTGSTKLPIIEEKSGAPALERAYTGSGAVRYNNSQAIGTALLLFSNGRFQNFNPTGGFDLRLPDIRGFDMTPAVLGLENNLHDESGYYFYIKNNGSASMTFKETYGNAWRTILSTPSICPPGSIRRLFITRGVWSASR